MKTVLLCIHGFCGTPRRFDAMIKKAPADWHICNITLAGHCKTVLDFYRADMDIWQKQVKSIVTRLSERYDRIVIAAHSMGCLFSIQAADTCEKIKGLFLIAPALTIMPKPSIFTDTLRLVYGNPESDTPYLKAFRKDCGIILNKRLWEYLLWIPNCVSLLIQANKTRPLAGKLKIPVTVVYSADDELVTDKSFYDFPSDKNVKRVRLNNSGHYCYERKDYRAMLKLFENFCKSI